MRLGEKLFDGARYPSQIAAFVVSSWLGETAGIGSGFCAIDHDVVAVRHSLLVRNKGLAIAKGFAESLKVSTGGESLGRGDLIVLQIVFICKAVYV